MGAGGIEAGFGIDAAVAATAGMSGVAVCWCTCVCWCWWWCISVRKYGAPTAKALSCDDAKNLESNSLLSISAWSKSNK